MTYALTFLSGVAVAAVLMWYYVGIVSKTAKSPRARLEYNAIAIYCSLLRGGHDHLDALPLSVGLAKDFGKDIDKEFK